MNRRVLAGIGICIVILGVAGWQTAGLLPSAITGMITAGTNVTITGSGTLASPYSIAATGGGGTTVAAAPPYISIAGTKYVAQTMWPYTAMFSGTYLDAQTATLTSGANGSSLFSYASTGNAWYGVSATSSIEAEFNVISRLTGTGSTTTGLNPAIAGIWIYDSTNSKIYPLRVYEMSSTGFNANIHYYLGYGSVWTYTGSGSPTGTATTDTVSQLGAAVPHLKLSVSGGTLTESISMDGGQTYTTLTTIGSIGTISKVGIYLGNEPTAANFYSVATN